MRSVYTALKCVTLGANAMKRVVAGSHIPTTWLFEPTERPDDRDDYCLDCSFLPQCKGQIPVFTLSGVRRALWANSGEGSAQ